MTPSGPLRGGARYLLLLIACGLSLLVLDLVQAHVVGTPTNRTLADAVATGG